MSSTLEVSNSYAQLSDGGYRDERSIRRLAGRSGIGGVKWRRTKLCASGLCALIGVGLLLVSLILPGVIDRAIERGVLETVRLDPNTMSQSAMEKYLNGTSSQDFYLFNITNLRAVLTAGEKMHVEEVRIRTIRHDVRYNVTWQTHDSSVRYQWLTAYEVLAEDRPLLDLPIVAPNPFHFGAAATVMQSFLASQAGQDPSSADWTPTAEFPGGFVSEQLLVAGFMGSQLLPGVLDLFREPKGPLLSQLRAAGVAFYAQFVPAFCAAANVSLDTALGSWASGTPFLSAIKEDYWRGFELPAPGLKSDNAAAIAHNLFDSANEFSFASGKGLAQWQTLAQLDPTSPEGQAQAARMMQGLGMNAPDDLMLVGLWLRDLGASMPSEGGMPAGVGDAYMAVVCASIFGAMQRAVAQGAAAGGTPFSRLYSDLASFEPHSWSDLGALQFSTGIVVGLMTGANTLVDGKGASTFALPQASGAGLPFAFNSGATEPEPMELFAGVQYYISHNDNIPPESAATWPKGAWVPLWQTNRAMLFDDGSDALRVLTLDQTKSLMQVLRGSGQAFGGLISQLQPVVVAYAGTFEASMQHTGDVAQAVAAATQAAKQQFETEAAKTGNLFQLAGITIENYYTVWTYLFSYLSNELQGTLAQLDSMGIAPQNEGLFTRRTAGQMLFGYDGRFPGVRIPGIAGVEWPSDPAGLQALLDADFLSHAGREWVEESGHKDWHKLGQWRQFEGVRRYQSNCDLVDPARTGVCPPAGSIAESSNNWRVWGQPVVVEGSGTSTQVAPFKEGEDKRPHFTSFYVNEVKRPVTVAYKGDMQVKGISLRRYGLYDALINASFVTPNPEKNVDQWRQMNVPDGLFSQQTVKGGVPAYASLPYFGLADSKVSSAVRCSCGAGGAGGVVDDCAQCYQPEQHDTWLALHPLTGLAMKGHKRLQASFRVSAQEYYTGPYAAYPAALPPGYPVDQPPGGINFFYNNLFAHSETLYLPYYWSDIHDELSDSDAKKVRDSESTVRTAHRVQKASRWGGLIGGGAILLAAIAACGYYYRSKPRR